MDDTQPDPPSSAEDPLQELSLFWIGIQRMLHRTVPDHRTLSETQAALLRFVDSSLTWGSVGLLVGSISSPWAKFLLPSAAIVMALSVLRANFFSGPNKRVEAVGNLFLFMVTSLAFIGLWFVIPKAPTQEEIAEAIARRLGTNPTPPVRVTNPSADEIAKSVVTRLPQNVASRTQPVESRLGNVSDSRLIEMAQDTAAQLRETLRLWRLRSEQVNMAIDDRLTYNSDHFTPEEQAKMRQQMEVNVRNEAKRWWVDEHVKDLFSRASDIQSQIRQRMAPSDLNASDVETERNLKTLLSQKDIPTVDDVRMNNLPNYLNTLRIRFAGSIASPQP